MLSTAVGTCMHKDMRAGLHMRRRELEGAGRHPCEKKPARGRREREWGRREPFPPASGGCNGSTEAHRRVSCQLPPCKMGGVEGGDLEGWRCSGGIKIPCAPMALQIGVE